MNDYSQHILYLYANFLYFLDHPLWGDHLLEITRRFNINMSNHTRSGEIILKIVNFISHVWLKEKVKCLNNNKCTCIMVGFRIEWCLMQQNYIVESSYSFLQYYCAALSSYKWLYISVFRLKVSGFQTFYCKISKREMLSNKRHHE